MNNRQLGRLEPVELRGHWIDEARDFTSWLATEEGLLLLSDALGMDLELVGQERQVGPFKADILARVSGEEEEHYVVVENQLEKTNHDHLGKIITYAAGLNARTIVWIARVFTEEHRQALDWLNEHSGQSLRFFGLQIELWRIGNSPPAPLFKIVSSPNETTTAVRLETAAVTSDTKQDQLLFWEELREFGRSRTSRVQYRKARPQHWYTLAIGRSQFTISLTNNTQQNRVGCEIFIRGAQAKQAFELLLRDRDAVERQIGSALDWQRLDDRIGSRIVLYRSGLDLDDPIQREQAKVWLSDMADKFHLAFSDRIKALQLAASDADESDEEA